MKKKVLIAFAILCVICLSISQVACFSNNDDSDKNGGTSGEEVYVQSVEFAEKTVNLDNDGEYTLNYTVTPAEGKVEFDVSEGGVFEYQKISDGVVKIKALSTGKGNFKIKSKTDGDTIFDECSVTVNAPDGYKLYENTSSRVKFVYPSDWKKIEMQNTMVCYQSSTTTSNINIMKQPKTTSHLTASKETFKSTLKNTYEQMGYNIVFNNCEVVKYNSGQSLKVVMDYTLKYQTMTAQIYQEQYMVNSLNNTYILTLTLVQADRDKGISEMIMKEFIGW